MAKKKAGKKAARRRPRADVSPIPDISDIVRETVPGPGGFLVPKGTPTVRQFAEYKDLAADTTSNILELANRAKIYLSIASILLGASFIKLDSLLAIASGSRIMLLLLAGGVISAFVAALSIVLSMRLRKLQNYFEPEVATEKLKSGETTDEAFLWRRLIDLEVSIKHNQDEARVRADWLQKTNLCLLASLCFILLFSVFAIGGEIMSGKEDQASDQDKAVPADNTRTTSKSMDVNPSVAQNKSDMGSMIDQLRKDRKDKPIYFQEGVIPDKTKSRLTEDDK